MTKKTKKTLFETFFSLCRSTRLTRVIALIGFYTTIFLFLIGLFITINNIVNQDIRTNVKFEKLK